MSFACAKAMVVSKACLRSPRSRASATWGTGSGFSAAKAAGNRIKDPAPRVKAARKAKWNRRKGSFQPITTQVKQSYHTKLFHSDKATKAIVSALFRNGRSSIWVIFNKIGWNMVKKSITRPVPFIMRNC